MVRTGKYTAEQLAQLAGLPLRTVRYYLQEELVDAPLGLGRGAHFDDKHLDQLKRIKLLQAGGFDLKAIRERGGDVEAILNGLHIGNMQDLARFRDLLGGFNLKAMSKLDPAVRRILAEYVRACMNSRELREEEDSGGGKAIRIPMAEGVNLLVDPDIEMPSPKDLVEIAMLIRKIFGEH